jgi:hypothetical protein
MVEIIYALDSLPYLDPAKEYGQYSNTQQTINSKDPMTSDQAPVVDPTTAEDSNPNPRHST